jgi:hypothetical protein
MPMSEVFHGSIRCAWTNDELTRIGAAEELEIATRRRDGTLQNPRTIWVVRAGDDLYVRSVNGPTAAWFRATRTGHEGHIQASGIDTDVALEDVDGPINDRIDAAYRGKYRRYPGPVDAINSEIARDTTMKLVPRDTSR